ncbi:MAG: hypothetical protein GYB64_08150 [Chloroflexi bacterium]|nr:hypothetical protein [Chloroflexota bacterium]
MPASVTKLENEPIITARYTSPMDFEHGFDESIGQIRTFAGEIDERIVLIADVRDLRLGFSEVVRGMGAVLRPGEARLPLDRSLIVIVGMGDLVKLVAHAAGQRQYGGITMRVVATYEEALAEGRAFLAQPVE